MMHFARDEARPTQKQSILKVRRHVDVGSLKSMGLTDIANFRENQNFIDWMTTVNHCTESKIRSLTDENYLGGWCEDWALYFAIRYGVDMLFLNEQHDLVKIGGLYYDGANPEGVKRLSDLKFVRDPANGLSEKIEPEKTEDGLSEETEDGIQVMLTEDELEAMLRVDDDWKSYPALANYVGIIEKVGVKRQSIDGVKMARQLVRLARELVAMPVDHWNGNTEDFDDWYHKAIDTIFREVNTKLSTFKLPFDYSIQYDESYETCREELEEDDDPVYKDAIGVAMFSNQTDADILPIAIDKEKIMMVYFDLFNPEAVSSELETTIWHETAHGLLQRFMDEFADAGTVDPEFKKLSGDVENTCETFGKAKGGLDSSAFGRWIKKSAGNDWTNIYGN